MSGILAFTHIMETGTLRQEALQQSIGYVDILILMIFYWAILDLNLD